MNRQRRKERNEYKKKRGKPERKKERIEKRDKKEGDRESWDGVKASGMKLGWQDPNHGFRLQLVNLSVCHHDFYHRIFADVCKIFFGDFTKFVKKQGLGVELR